MPGIFNTGDSGPSQAEIDAKVRAEAERRARDLRGLAIRDSRIGVEAQLLGSREVNPSFNAPTQFSPEANFSSTTSNNSSTPILGA